MSEKNVVLKHGIEFFEGELKKNPCRKCVEVELSNDFIDVVEDLEDQMKSCSCDLTCYCECICDTECYCECRCLPCECFDDCSCEEGECVCTDETENCSCVCECGDCECFEDCDCEECKCEQGSCDGNCQECDCDWSDDMDIITERINTKIISLIAYYERESGDWILTEDRRRSEFPEEDINNIRNTLKKSFWNSVNCEDLMFINKDTKKLFFSKTKCFTPY